MEHPPSPPEPLVHEDVRAGFHGELDAIDDAFVAAAVEIVEALPRFTAAFLDGSRETIGEAIDLSVRVSETIEDMEDRGFVLLAREAPVAGDLRRLVALLRLTTDVDRSAALLKHVCLTLERFDPRTLPEGLRTQLSELAERSTRVFAAGIDAWRRRDPTAVHAVDDDDEDVDRLQQRLLDDAVSVDDGGDEMLVLGLIARYYERIADHGVAIAQDTTFVVTGERRRVGKRRQREEAEG